MHNFYALPQGPAEKRNGTIYSASGKTAGKKVILVPWTISPTEGRVLEFGHQYIRYYSGVTGAQLLDTGTPVETVTTYTEAELPYIRTKQVSTYLYITCVGHKEAKLTRTSDTVWTLADVTNTAGAGEEDFSTNYPALIEFYEDRKLHAKIPTKKSTFWGSRVAQYESFALRSSATVTTPIASPGFVNWAAHPFKGNESVCFAVTGGALPTGLTVGVVYYVQTAGITAGAFKVSSSPGGADINFTGTSTGTQTGYSSPALATDAWEKTPLVQRNAEILWLLAGDALLFGTSEGPYRVGGKEQILTGDGAWWPQRQAAVGCADVQAIMVDDFACFVGKTGKHIYRFEYQQASDKYVPDDLMFLCNHLASAGVIGMVHQREPETVLWAWTSDGILLSGCYSRTTNSIGWSDHGPTGLVESVCAIPTTIEDMVWLSVARTIGGTVVRHIEYLAPREWTLTRDYHGVDAAVVWDGGAAKTVTSISKANPAVCTSTAHGFANNDLVRFWNVTGITDVNGEVYTVKNKTADNFELYTRNGATAIDFSGQASAGSGGTVEKVTNSITGLAHLNGETVKTWGDGATIADAVVSGGAITLSEYANKIRTGLGFTASLEPMLIAEAQNKLKRITKIWAQFYKTVDAQYGRDALSMHQVAFDGLPYMDTSPDAQTASSKNLFDGYSGYDSTVRIESKNPGPCTVCAITSELVSER
jgi:hypothetical protein